MRLRFKFIASEGLPNFEPNVFLVNVFSDCLYAFAARDDDHTSQLYGTEFGAFEAGKYKGSLIQFPLRSPLKIEIKTISAIGKTT